jgi:hypothetical protein
MSGQQQQLLGENRDISKNIIHQGHERSRTMPEIHEIAFKDLGSKIGGTSVVVPFAVRLHRRLNSNSFKTDPDSLASMPFF